MRRIVALAVLFLFLLILGVAIVSFGLFHQSNNSSTLSVVSSSLTGTQGNFTVRLTDSLPLPSVGDRFDHMAIDPQSQSGFHRSKGK